MATPEETKETMQTETTSDNEVKETVEETTNETAVENDEATFDTIKKELEAQKELLQQSEDHYKRLQADFANFRRRNEKEREELSSVVLQGLIKDVLPIIDNLERALAVEGAAGTPLHDGISMVYNQLMESLKKNGLEVIKAAGEKFDPNFHQAVMRVQDPEKEDDTIEEEFQKGYMVQGRVIRPSMVKVVAN
ncbi:MAG: nucleotide exchange factor GrpE [Megamonas funiformis]|uniref:nucleotide exchange factor GrpE n=1 Tax=Megamonas funiformis TaxID=437897 RepID=UPI001EC43061|nr:nucleotide exchange factor GrpE [Megamonas funiformis]MBS7212716.1 nucleotide exchange factor GrpE [Megamonas funiformis]